MNNNGFDSTTIAQYKQRIQAESNNYILSEEDQNTDEYAHVFFIGKHEGQEVIYDAVLYTLRLHHEGELFEIAEHRAAKHFPEYGKISADENENPNLSEELEEKIGMFIAEVIVTLEEEGEVQVQEHVDLDDDADFGIGLDVGLNVEEITPAVITRFISQFNDGTLKLDPLHYSFQTQSGEAE
jgi:hypothetical protein